jgi:hypothetical protein
MGEVSQTRGFGPVKLEMKWEAEIKIVSREK